MTFLLNTFQTFKFNIMPFVNKPSLNTKLFKLYTSKLFATYLILFIILTFTTFKYKSYFRGNTSLNQTKLIIGYHFKRLIMFLKSIFQMFTTKFTEKYYIS